MCSKKTEVTNFRFIPMMRFLSSLFKMRKMRFFFLMLLGVMLVQSEQNYDHYIMSEAGIQEYRDNENEGNGYTPFYAECNFREGNSDCTPAIPTLNRKEGYVTVSPKADNTIIVYGCLMEVNQKTLYNKLYNSKYFKKALLLRQVKGKLNVNIYNYKCTSKISPTMWKTRTGVEGSYHIGFQVVNHDDIPLVEVLFDHNKKIPLRTKHILYGASLSTPIAPFDSRRELMYRDGSYLTEQAMEKDYQSYDRFNDDIMIKEKLNKILKKYKVNAIPHNSKISMAHLIPENDMPANVWKNVAKFVETIAPMWTTLYDGVWADVEEAIQKLSFMNEEDLTIYSGAHGQLTFDERRVPKEENKFFLNEKDFAVPEFIWKLVVNKKPTREGWQEPVEETLAYDENSDEKGPQHTVENLSVTIENPSVTTTPPGGRVVKFINMPPEPSKTEFTENPNKYGKQGAVKKGGEEKRMQAIVIILYNVANELHDLEIFTPMKPPCVSKCSTLNWRKIDQGGIIYCCTVKDVRHLIDEFPDTGKYNNFDGLLYNVVDL